MIQGQCWFEIKGHLRLFQPKKETPLPGRRASGTSTGGVIIDNIIARAWFVNSQDIFGIDHQRSCVGMNRKMIRK